MIGINGVYQSMEITKASVHNVHYLNEVKYSGIGSCLLLGDKGYLSAEWQLDVFTSANIELKTQKGLIKKIINPRLFLLNLHVNALRLYLHSYVTR